MDNQRASITIAAVLLLVMFVIGGITWINYQYAAQNQDMNKFVPRWKGTRLFMTEGLNPYSQETTNEVERMVYGRTTRSNEETGLFVYPFYSILIYAPFALFSEYNLAFALWMTVLELALAALVVVSMLLSDWRPPVLVIMILFVYTFLWYHALRPLISGNISILIALFITAAFLAIRSELDVFAGFLLALASIKPQMVLVVYIFIIIWAISKGRWTIIWGLFGSLFFMAAIGSLFFQNWVIEYIRQVIRYSEVVFISTPGSIISHWLPGIGTQTGWILTGVMVALLLIEWRASLGQDSRWFIWTAMLTVVASSLIGVYITLENYIMLFPAMILILSIWDKRWGLLGKWLMIVFILITSIGIWWLLLSGVQRGIQPDLNPIIFLFSPLALIFGLYWIRWWSINPVRLPLEELSDYLG
jgi:hypothetical protein